ncbi:MAG TPA: response regulator transcription factor [Actinomycetes bacterium]|jgi:two-component system, NarL family, nitrate/nitrite response regulator NarL|nr:response regulator transcription factor [Actinomycetes bacterium]
MKIVLGDDHEMWLQALEVALLARGHHVVATATTASGAVDAVVGSDPDVCALDVGFPDGNGFEAARRIREEAPRTRVVMLTGSSEPSLVDAAVSAGAAGLTRKDQSVTAIMAALERVAAGASAFDSRWSRSTFTRQRPESDVARLVNSLTTRERDVLRRLVDGCTTSEIAREMGVTKNTARTHIQNVLTKMGAHSRLQAATQVVHAQLVDLL